MLKALFVLVTIGTITNSSYCAQNDMKNPQLIIFNQGDDTKIPKTFIVLNYKRGCTEHTVLGAGKSNVQEKFTNLFSEEISFINEKTPEEHMVLFRPTIIKVTQNNMIENLGSLSSFNTHQEAHSAIAQKKAVFYDYKQGAIIYFLDKPHCSFIETKLQEINAIIESNLPRNIFLRLFTTFSGF